MLIYLDQINFNLYFNQTDIKFGKTQKLFEKCRIKNY